MFGGGGGCVVAVGGGRGPSMMGADTHAIGDPDVPETTFAGPDLTVFLGLEPLGWG